MEALAFIAIAALMLVMAFLLVGLTVTDWCPWIFLCFLNF